MHMDLFFDHYFNFLCVKIEINKNGLKVINAGTSKALTRQRSAIWLIMIGTVAECFEFDVILTELQLFLKMHSHISVLWRSCRISKISVVSFWGKRMKKITWRSRKIFLFGFIKLKCVWICFLITVLFFWVLKVKQTKRIQLKKYSGVKSSHKTNTWHINGNVTESFWLSFFNVMALLWNFCNFWIYFW